MSADDTPRVVTFVENDGRTPEEIFGHPAQYAYVGRTLVLNSGHATDAELRDLAGVWGSVERFNRCLTCEQWAPCDMRKTR